MIEIKKGIDNSLWDVTIDGELISDRIYHIFGNVKVDYMEVKTLHIHDTGDITGKIKANTILNHGKLEGEVIANKIKDFSDNLIIEKISDNKYLVTTK